jgi:threonine-phosphate decarboxylase
MAVDSIPVHGGQLRDIAERFQVGEESLLDFSASISPIPPKGTLIEALCESMRNHKVLTQYPDSEYRDLKNAIAAYARIERGSICVANGITPLLDAALRALGLRRCLILVPAFGEYQRVFKSCGVEGPTLMLCEDNNFVPSPDLILQAAIASRADAVLLANPHSPSGSLTQVTVLSQLRRALSRLGIALILDEAFIDFCPESSVSDSAANESGLVVLRSLTKFFAIPGMRVAYAVAHPEVRAMMESILPLWPVDSLAASAAQLGLLDKANICERQQANARERQWLSEQLISLGCRVFPSSANYLLIKPPSKVDGIEIWRRLIIEHRIVLRNCGTFDGLTDGHFRIAVRDHLANLALTTSLVRLF